MPYLVTGTAGFIGFHVANALLTSGHEVVGLDGMTDYYDVELKRRRHRILREHDGFKAHEVMLEDAVRLSEIYEQLKPSVVIHLAAQAGVRYSLENPLAYINANILGTFNLLELTRRYVPQHLLLASTSSVYGANAKMPFEERDQTDQPLTLYAASKKATENMAHSYSHLWHIPTTVLRFFSVYGPWGRPDMALFKFTKAVVSGEPIELYNGGNMQRDFTFIDDLTKAIVLLARIPPNNPGDANGADHIGVSPSAPFRIVNIGNGAPVHLLQFVEAIERSLGMSAERVSLPMQAGDVAATFASTELLYRLTQFRPETPVAIGVDRFVKWYKEFYGT